MCGFYKYSPCESVSYKGFTIYRKSLLPQEANSFLSEQLVISDDKSALLVKEEILTLDP